MPASHGHNYLVTLTVGTVQLDGYEFLADFGDLQPFRRHLETTLDRRRLNDVVDLHPTSELLA